MPALCRRGAARPGANIWNMGFYGCFVGYYLIYRPLLRSRRGKTPWKLVLASILGCVVSLQLGAFSVVLETSLSGITELPFWRVFGADAANPSGHRLG